MKDLNRSKQEAGFTLIEIAIVVVIIGLLLGGVLKGQEMIKNARVHNLIDQGSAVKAAILGFQDRFMALPGDFSQATDNIDGTVADTGDNPTPSSSDDGDGNGRVGGDPMLAGDSTSDDREAELALVWKHLASSGFVTGSYVSAADDSVDNLSINEDTWECGVQSCMTNVYGGPLFFAYTDEAYTPYDEAAAETLPTFTGDGSMDARSHQLIAGNLVPVSVLSEMDRKMDDAAPTTGSFRIGDRYATDTEGGNQTLGSEADTGSECVASGAVSAGSAGPPGPPRGPAKDSTNDVDHYDVLSQYDNCGAVHLF
ncbi:MAG: prepilin-type N-terminal cleavage/methylation domain-containing protein [Magnetococcales bacterium]|nr:prepilin-type N-terminal cleavage/methylation domain-containing protein [Magnetococcales bacterium]